MILNLPSYVTVELANQAWLFDIKNFKSFGSVGVAKKKISTGPSMRDNYMPKNSSQTMP